MKRPAFQFYPADWRNNAKLRRCSEAARGAWIDVLCLMHDSDEYGVLRWPLAEIARAAGLPLKLLKELADRDVLKGGDKGCEAFYHIPVHARKQGEPILLIEETDQPCWYSSRFLVDEWRRLVKGSSTRFSVDEQSPEDSPSRGKVKGKVNGNAAPNIAPSARPGDGSTSTSSSTDIKPSVVESGSVNPAVPIPTLTNPGLVCKHLRELGMATVNPSHQTLVALVQAGASLQEFIDVAEEQKARPDGKFNFAYVLSTVKGRRADAAKLVFHQGALPNKQQAIEDRNRHATTGWQPPELREVQS